MPSMYCRTYELAMEKVVSNTLCIEIERIEESKEKQRTHLGRISFAKVDGCNRIRKQFVLLIPNNCFVAFLP